MTLETGLSGDRFHFNANGDGPARYNIIHFKQVQPGKYRWIKVGEYYEGELRLNMDGMPSFHPLYAFVYIYLMCRQKRICPSQNFDFQNAIEFIDCMALYRE